MNNKFLTDQEKEEIVRIALETEEGRSALSAAIADPFVKISDKQRQQLANVISKKKSNPNQGKRPPRKHTKHFGRS